VTAARRIADEERRARLARRHALAPAHRAANALEAARRVVCLHATDPATVFLSCWARVDRFTVADLERALHVDRTLVKHLAMRRTLFVFPRERLADAQAGASARVAVQERKRQIRLVEEGGLQRNGARWLDKVSAEVLAVLASGRALTYPELKKEVPRLEGSVTFGEGKSWGGNFPVGPRALTVLSAAGEIVRATNAGGWTTSRPRWASMATWLGAALEARTEAQGIAALVAAWLRAFGPGTERDLQWWLGSTLTAVRRALTAVDAVAVDLDGGATGYVLPDDVDEAKAVKPWVALLPALDPTTMGWADRAWYVGAHKAEVFDRNGNAGPTIWCDGRIVGGWCQRDDKSVEIHLLERVGRGARTMIDAEARRLTAWLSGARPLPRFPSPLSKRMAARTP
jgi:hypothetical protein